MAKLIMPGQFARNLRGIDISIKGGGNGTLTGLFEALPLRMAESARRRLVNGIDPEGRPHKRRAGLTQWSTRGSKPGRDTGQLARSIRGTKERIPRGVKVYWGSPHFYAKVYEEGATIRPKAAKLLTVPLTRKAKRYRAREYPDPLTLIRGRSGRFWLVHIPKGKTGSWKFVYALIPKAVVPARSHLPVSQTDVDWIDRHIEDALHEDTAR